MAGINELLDGVRELRHLGGRLDEGRNCCCGDDENGGGSSDGGGGDGEARRGVKGTGQKYGRGRGRSGGLDCLSVVANGKAIRHFSSRAAKLDNDNQLTSYRASALPPFRIKGLELGACNGQTGHSPIYDSDIVCFSKPGWTVSGDGCLSLHAINRNNTETGACLLLGGLNRLVVLAGDPDLRLGHS